MNVLSYLDVPVFSMCAMQGILNDFPTLAVVGVMVYHSRDIARMRNRFLSKFQDSHRRLSDQ